MGRRSRSRSASHSPSRSSRRAPANSSSTSASSSRRRREDDASRGGGSHRHRSRSRSKSRSPHRRHGGSSRRRSSSDLDANDSHRKKQRTERDDASGADVKGERSSAAVDGGGGGAVKANTTEKNGEISMSIEETNRVRAALGLKPLSLGPKKKDENVVNLQKTSEQVDEERERAELQKKLAQSKKKRELTQKLAGQSIGEQLKASASGSALDWVKQSRAKVDDAAADEKKSKKRAKKQGEGELYDASALAGMVVGHDVKSFEEGDEVVLTLKDSRVLAQDGNDLNDEQDELVNVELSERDRRHAEKQRAQRALMPAYTGFDDDEFIQMGKPNRMKKPARLLSQYDDDDDRKASQQAQKFTLDASGSTKVTSGDDANGASGGGLDNDVAVVSLAMDKTKSIDEYYTQEEIDAQFAKKKGKKLRKKKKLRLQQTAEGNEEGGGEGGEGESAASLVQQLEAEALKNASKDRGRRRRRVEEDDDSKQSGIEEENLLRFQEARERANATASNALLAMTATKKKRRPVALDDDVLDGAMDMELSASLAQTRRLAQLKEATHAGVGADSSNGEATAPSAITSEDRIAALVSQTIGVEPSITDVSSSVTTTTASSGSMNAMAQVVGQVFGESMQNLETSGNAVVFNEATDFETRLKNAMEQRSAQFQAATMEAAAAAAQLGRQAEPAGVVAPAQPSASRDDGDEEMKGGEEDESGDADEEETKDGEVWGEEQPLVGSGMAATLALLRKTGDLRETRVERQAGRANDARDRNVDDELRVKDGVKLDYRDEFGRLLTKKEAFRLLSYKFHGHEPGKKKKEKRLKQLKEELEAQKMLSGEGSTKMMKVLEKKQKVSKQAHVVLSGGT